MDKSQFVHGWTRTTTALVTGFGILWTVIIGTLAVASILDAIGSFGWGMGKNVWLLIGMTAFGVGFVWMSRRVGKSVGSITTKIYGPDHPPQD